MKLRLQPGAQPFSPRSPYSAAGLRWRPASPPAATLTSVKFAFLDHRRPARGALRSGGQPGVLGREVPASTQSAYPYPVAALVQTNHDGARTARSRFGVVPDRNVRYRAVVHRDWR